MPNVKNAFMIENLTDIQIKEVLQNNRLGHIRCNDGHKTYVVPINYVYDGNFIIAHSAEGMKIDIMRKQPKVCFEVEEIISFTNWKSVIAWGEYQELKEERERYYAIKVLVDNSMHLKMSQFASFSSIFDTTKHTTVYGTQKPVIYRIILNEITGKFESE